MNIHDVIKSLVDRPASAFFIGLLALLALYLSFICRNFLGDAVWASIATFSLVSVVAEGIAIAGIWAFCTKKINQTLTRRKRISTLQSLSSPSKNILMGMIAKNRRTVELGHGLVDELVDNDVLYFVGFGREQSYLRYRVADEYWPLISNGKFKILYRGRNQPCNPPSTYGF